MKICNIFSAICINLPGERTGKRGRPRIHRERIRLESIPLKKPEGADYYMGCRKVITIYGRGNLSTLMLQQRIRRSLEVSACS